LPLPPLKPRSPLKLLLPPLLTLPSPLKALPLLPPLLTLPSPLKLLLPLPLLPRRSNLAS
jgi:hypothetical protein